MSETAFWTRLDRMGHDAALLRPCADGWLLQGAAAFAHEAGPAAVAYQIEVDVFWRTRRGRVSGFLSERLFEHDIRRDGGVWSLDGAIADGFDHLVDLDFGFTPATNILQLRRMALPVRGRANFPVVWFDLDSVSLVELPQTYERRSESSYWYTAPTVPYEALLQIAPGGFVELYPSLWRRES